MIQAAGDINISGLVDGEPIRFVELGIRGFAAVALEAGDPGPANGGYRIAVTPADFADPMVGEDVKIARLVTGDSGGADAESGSEGGSILVERPDGVAVAGDRIDEIVRIHDADGVIDLVHDGEAAPFVESDRLGAAQYTLRGGNAVAGRRASAGKGGDNAARIDLRIRAFKTSLMNSVPAAAAIARGPFSGASGPLPTSPRRPASPVPEAVDTTPAGVIRNTRL